MSSATLVCSRRCGSPASARRSSGPGDGNEKDGDASGMSAGGTGRRGSLLPEGPTCVDPVGALKLSAAGVETMIGGGSGRTAGADTTGAATGGGDAIRGASVTRAVSCGRGAPSPRNRSMAARASSLASRCSSGAAAASAAARAQRPRPGRRGSHGRRCGRRDGLGDHLFAFARSRRMTTGFGRDACRLRRLVGGFFQCFSPAWLFRPPPAFQRPSARSGPFQKCPWP